MNEPRTYDRFKEGNTQLFGDLFSIFDKTGSNPVSSGIVPNDGGCWTCHANGGQTVSERWLSADEVAAHIGVTKDTVYAWIADRGMPAHKIGRIWKFQISEVDDWVRGGGADTLRNGPGLE